MEEWPVSGVPDNPGAWLMATAKNPAIDRMRRGEMSARTEEELGREVELRARLVERGYAASGGENWIRVDLSEEAMLSRLGPLRSTGHPAKIHRF